MSFRVTVNFKANQEGHSGLYYAHDPRKPIVNTLPYATRTPPRYEQISDWHKPERNPDGEWSDETVDHGISSVQATNVVGYGAHVFVQGVTRTEEWKRLLLFGRSRKFTKTFRDIVGGLSTEFTRLSLFPALRVYHAGAKKLDDAVQLLDVVAIEAPATAIQTLDDAMNDPNSGYFGARVDLNSPILHRAFEKFRGTHPRDDARARTDLLEAALGDPQYLVARPPEPEEP